MHDPGPDDVPRPGGGGSAQPDVPAGESRNDVSVDALSEVHCKAHVQQEAFNALTGMAVGGTAVGLLVAFSLLLSGSTDWGFALAAAFVAITIIMAIQAVRQ